MPIFLLLRVVGQTRTTAQKLQSGEYECPRCESKRPCTHVHIAKTTFLFGLLPVGAPDGVRDVIRCDTCSDESPAENYKFDSTTDTFNLVEWECPYCKHSNPNTRYRCMKCERSLI